MKHVLLALSLFAIYAAPAYSAPPLLSKPTTPAQKPVASLPPQKYEMALIFIADGKPHEYIFTINNAVGFKTVAALKESIGNFPPGSTLTWAPSDCRLIGDESALSSPAAMADFEAFCRSKKIKFVLVPGG